MVTYVPDVAKVREKTLVASTRNTLLRELGTDRFAETIFATTMVELTAEGFKKHDSHVAKYILACLLCMPFAKLLCKALHLLLRRNAF